MSSPVEQLIAPITDSDRVIRVKSTSNVNSTASKIAMTIDEAGGACVQIRAMGAGSVNQAAKAVAVARGMLATKAQDLWCRIGFDKVRGEQGDDVSVVVFRLEVR